MPNLALRHAPTGLQAGAPRSALSPVAECAALVAEELAAAEAALPGFVAAAVPAVTEISSYLVGAGGKRLRPLLTALGARAVGHRGPITRLMCAGEVLHLGSLLHDDVVDDGHERRGQPAAHRVYGNAGAILAGDFCLAQAVLLAGEEGGPKATLELARVVTHMAEGEVLQLLHRGDLALSRDAYFDIIDRKSAALIAWCAAAGAMAAGDTRAAAALERFGRGVGVAFQITDDVLDYTGHAALLGKRPGQDLAERKLTLPLLIAFERVPGLRTELLAGPPRPERVPALLDAVVASGAAATALEDARRRVDDAVAALATLPDGPHRAGLVRLAWHLVERVA